MRKPKQTQRPRYRHDGKQFRIDVVNCVLLVFFRLSVRRLQNVLELIGAPPSGVAARTNHVMFRRCPQNMNARMPALSGFYAVILGGIFRLRFAVFVWRGMRFEALRVQSWLCGDLVWTQPLA